MPTCRARRLMLCATTATRRAQPPEHDHIRAHIDAVHVELLSNRERDIMLAAPGLGLPLADVEGGGLVGVERAGEPGAAQAQNASGLPDAAAVAGETQHAGADDGEPVAVLQGALGG